MIMLTPSLDGKFITATMKQDKPNPVPYVVGMNNTEGCGILSVTMPKDFMKGIAKEVLIATLKGYIGELIYVSFPNFFFNFSLNFIKFFIVILTLTELRSEERLICQVADKMSAT